ncbi:hypothetical protein HZH68_012191 [Vespula germanica]|uniref:Uncharacterized protein n=1 Tax=Vespula germanica TaxID=30212 RepID=A0A834MYC0_VESGE|nr:hypothetical protein HZH68_012191 [Vespula germanica]
MEINTIKQIEQMLLRVTSAEALNTYVQVEFVRVLVSKAPSNVEEEGEEEEEEGEEEEEEEGEEEEEEEEKEEEELI